MTSAQEVVIKARSDVLQAEERGDLSPLLTLKQKLPPSGEKAAPAATHLHTPPALNAVRRRCRAKHGKDQADDGRAGVDPGAHRGPRHEAEDPLHAGSR